MFLKVIACEIAFREICHAAAQSPNLIDLEFLSQGLHDVPCAGREQLQARLNAVPTGKYDAILVGYGLCGGMINGLTTPHTPLVIPRAHDCITLFLGSRERYAQTIAAQPGAYYYTSGWLECLRRRGEKTLPDQTMFLPTRAALSGNASAAYELWVKKFGEDQARYLSQVMDQWTSTYTHGVLIDFDFSRPLRLRDQVEAVCAKRGWQFGAMEGDLRLLQHWLNGEWTPEDFLIVTPSRKVTPSYDQGVIQAEAVDSPASRHEAFDRAPE
ncbi:MAG: DUF1638 domain-containing protein [Verrucomicrobia bacterium]|nr:DUF1638 domain-containing protein [Verrucomicrobiota bacterium]